MKRVLRAAKNECLLGFVRAIRFVAISGAALTARRIRKPIGQNWFVALVENARTAAMETLTTETTSFRLLAAEQIQ
jgi:hypothetical protein